MSRRLDCMLQVGDLELEVRLSPRRSTIQITVDRDGSLLLLAPPTCTREAMQRFVNAKRFWIYTKLAQKEALRPDLVVKQYVDGEGFPYLGRSHRLLLVHGQDVAVKLEHGRFKLDRALADEGREHMVRWYSERALPWLSRRIEDLQGRVGVSPAGVSVRELGYRWGSCGSGRVNFHWRTILLPPRAIDYVVVHELVHLIEPHHTLEFWRHIERVLPDYDGRKRWLAEKGAAATAV